MSLNGLDDASITDAFQAALAEPGGWFVLRYASRDAVQLLARGSGGVAELREAVASFEEPEPLYGFLKFRRRNVLVKYVPEGISRLLQARVAVHFVSITEAFARHDTIFTIASAADLRDSALSAACSLHAASHSTSSSNSSLQRPRLGEIVEDAEESRSVRDEADKPLPPLPPDPTSGRPPREAPVIRPPRSSSPDTERAIRDAVLNATASATDPDRTRDRAFSAASSRGPTGIEVRPSTAGPPPVMEPRAVDEPRVSSSSARPATRDLANAHGLGLRPKVKLGPRPSLDHGVHDVRPVSALPAGLKLGPRRPTHLAPSKPPQQSVQEVPSPASLHPALSTPPAAGSPSSGLDPARPSTASSTLSARTISAVASASLASNTPGKPAAMSASKQKLMKALQLRRKQAEAAAQAAQAANLVATSADAAPSNATEASADPSPSNATDASSADPATAGDTTQTSPAEVASEVVEDGAESVPAATVVPATEGKLPASSSPGATLATVPADLSVEPPRGGGHEKSGSSPVSLTDSHEPASTKASSVSDHADPHLSMSTERAAEETTHAGPVDACPEDADRESGREDTSLSPASLQTEVKRPAEVDGPEPASAIATGPSTSMSPAIIPADIPTDDGLGQAPAVMEGTQTTNAERPSSTVSADRDRTTPGPDALAVVDVHGDAPAAAKTEDGQTPKRSGAGPESELDAVGAPPKSAVAEANGHVTSSAAEASARSTGAAESVDGEADGDHFQEGTFLDVEDGTDAESGLHEATGLDAPRSSPPMQPRPRVKAPVPADDAGRTSVHLSRRSISSTSSGSKRSSTEEPSQPLPKKRRGVDPIRTDIEPDDSDDNLLSDESLMNELRAATVQEARPVSVRKSPLNAAFPRGPHDSWVAARAASNPSSSRSTTLANGATAVEVRNGGRDRSTSGSALSTHGSKSGPMAMIKKINVSSGISQRIKALEMLSSQTNGATTPSSDGQTSQAASPVSPARRSSVARSPSTRHGPAKKGAFSLFGSKSPTPAPSTDSAVVAAAAPKPIETISVKARIVKDSTQPFPAAGEITVDPNELNSLDLQHSPLVIEHHQTMPAAMGVVPPPTPTPLRRQKSRRERPRSGISSGKVPRSTPDSPSPTSARRLSNTSRHSTSSAGRSEAKSPPPGSRLSSSSVSAEEPKEHKKESTKSRIFRRMSSISGGSRKSSRNVVSPTLREEDGVVDSAGPSPGRRASLDVGEVNVQFPDSLLWKRRRLKIDSQGYITLSQSKPDEVSRAMAKRYHLTEFNPPFAPDQDGQELPNSVILDLRDGGTLQCACEHPAGQEHVLKNLGESYHAWVK